MDEQTVLYLRRWSLAFEQVAATRSEPSGSKKSGYYSNRTARKHRRPNGHEFELDSRHQSVWCALANRAFDLSMSRATTWVSLEALSQESSLSSAALSAVHRDLIDVGLIRRKTRGHNTTSETTMFLFPLDADQNDPDEVIPVLIGEDNMPYYICQAALERKGKHSEKRVDEESEGLQRIVNLLREAFPKHQSLSNQKTEASLKADLTECVTSAGTERRCYDVLRHVLSKESPEGLRVVELLGASGNLGAYIRHCFSAWYKEFEIDQP